MAIRAPDGANKNDVNNNDYEELLLLPLKEILLASSTSWRSSEASPNCWFL